VPRKTEGLVPGDDGVNRDQEYNSNIVPLELWFIVISQVQEYKRKSEDRIDKSEYAANEPPYPMRLEIMLVPKNNSESKRGRKEGQNTSH
jgi:hypothetical protein